MLKAAVVKAVKNAEQFRFMGVLDKQIEYKTIRKGKENGKYISSIHQQPSVGG